MSVDMETYLKEEYIRKGNHNDDHEVEGETWLYPCPFCGKKAEYVPVKNLINNATDYYIRCTGCQIETLAAYATKGLARKFWTRRVKI